MLMIMMSFGDFSFRLPSIVYQELSHKRSARFATNPRVGAGDAWQFVGPGPEVISLSGVTAWGINRASASYARLNGLMQQGVEQALVDGLGNVFGQYVLLSVDISKENFTKLGQAKRTEFTLELERVDNPGGAIENVILEELEGKIEDVTGSRFSIASLGNIL